MKHSDSFHWDNRTLIVVTAIAGILTHLHFGMWFVTCLVLFLPIWGGILQILVNLLTGHRWNETMEY